VRETIRRRQANLHEQNRLQGAIMTAELGVGTFAFNTVVHWRELNEVENKCTLYNFRLFAIFVPKIISIGGNLTKL